MQRLIEGIRGFTEYCLYDVLKQHLGLSFFPFGRRHGLSSGPMLSVGSNEEAWAKFRAGEAYDTRRLTLEHFHLFEWFPQTPGRFHTEDAKQRREYARQHVVETDGERFFDHFGKTAMIDGGVGAVRFRPRRIGDEPYYFMTASSTNVCHEGFPVLVPRRLFGQLKPRIIAEGAVPVTLTGEMRYVDEEEIPKKYGYESSHPFLYLHVDDAEVLRHERREISSYNVSAAVSVLCKSQRVESDGDEMGAGAEPADNEPRLYSSYATFDPSRQSSIDDACRWISEFYVGKQYGGEIVTDFDEVQPRFPQAVFGLPRILRGNVKIQDVSRLLTEGSSFGHSEFAPLMQVFFQTFYSSQVGGDVINVGGVSNSQGVSIGKYAKSSVVNLGRPES